MLSLASVAGGLGCLVVARWLYDVCYSMFFSPLRDIPGPMCFHLFPFYETFLTLTGRLAWVERDLHDHYGRVYRKGRMVQFASEEAMREIYATHAYRKSDMYAMVQSEAPTIFSTIDRDFHRKRKRLMAPAFSQKEIFSLGPVILESVYVLVALVEARAESGTAVDIYSLFRSLTLDLIGVLGFGQSFNTLTQGPHPLQAWYAHTNVRLFAEILVPALRNFSNPPETKLKAFALAAIDRVRELDTPSIMAGLVKAKDPETGATLNDKDLVGEALLQIFAGSDSTANAMTWILYFLLKHPPVYATLVEEFSSRLPRTVSLADCRAGMLPFFDAVIKETMRLMPVAAGSLERVVPSGGRTIDGYFLPEGVISNCKLTFRQL